MPLTPEEKLARKRAWGRAAMAKWRAANLEKAREDSRMAYAANREKRVEYRRKYVEANPGASRAWQIANPEKARASNSAYRASKLKACPPWADRAHLAFIYANCPDGYAVDHIIPLRGKGFGGLHVPANLQYLPALVNIAKGNRCVDVSTSAIVPPMWQVTL